LRFVTDKCGRRASKDEDKSGKERLPYTPLAKHGQPGTMGRLEELERQAVRIVARTIRTVRTSF
jgi:hypothetical protein